MINERNSADGLVVLGVSDEDPGKAWRYLEGYGIGSPSLHDEVWTRNPSAPEHAAAWTPRSKTPKAMPAY